MADDVSWKEYVDLRIASLEDATAHAAKEMERRLEGMNEVRRQLDKQANTFITRLESEGIAERIKSLELTRAEMSGKASQSSVTTATIIALIGILTGLAGIIIAVVR